MGDEWFRSAAWDGAAREDFERRLLRSRRTSRAQYLRIKAIALGDAGEVDDALGLLRRLIDEYPDSFDVPLAFELIGDYERAAGRLTEAESSYRHVLALWPDLNTTSGMVHTSLAEVLLAEDHEVTDAMHLLEQAVPHLRFNSEIFRWNLALARAADRLGDLETRRHAARRALELVERGPQLSRHPDVGLARPDSATLGLLRRLAV
jgi:predicted Zn-dependent protease